MIKVLLGDDHRIVREGLKQVLADPSNGSPDIQVRAEATTGDEVLAQVEALQGDHGLDLVLLDIAMPGRDGLDVLQNLRKSRARTGAVPEDGRGVCRRRDRAAWSR